jgi:hypothetical protein
MLIIAETDALIARLEAALDPAGRAGFRAAAAAPYAVRGEFLRRVAAKLETRRPEEIGVGPLTLTDRHFSTRRARSKKFCRSSRMSSGGEAAAAPGESLHDQSPYRPRGALAPCSARRSRDPSTRAKRGECGPGLPASSW